MWVRGSGNVGNVHRHLAFGRRSEAGPFIGSRGSNVGVKLLEVTQVGRRGGTADGVSLRGTGDDRVRPLTHFY